MKDFLFCHVKDCGYFIGADIDASFEEWGEVIDEFKEHLRTHTVDELVDYLFSMIVLVRHLVEGDE